MAGADVSRVALLPTGIRKSDIASAAAVVAIWTSFVLFSRLGLKQAFTAWDMAFVRFLFAGLAVLPLFLPRPAGRRLGKLSVVQAGTIAVLAGLGFTCISYIGFTYAPAAHGAVLMPGTLPFSVAVVAWFMIDERISVHKAAGLALILLGVICVGWYSLSDAGTGHWRGDIAFPLASLCWAFFTVLARKWRVDPVDAIIAASLISALLYIPVYWLWLPKQIMQVSLTTIVLQGLMQGVLALAVSMWLYTRVVAAFGPTRTTMFTAICPGLAALLAVPLLGEPLVPLVVLGLVLVTLGIVVGVSTGTRATASSGAVP